MTYGSVCSGIEAATVAWEPLGWRAAWFAEIDPFCAALLEAKQELDPPVEEPHYEASYDDLPEALEPQGEE